MMKLEEIPIKRQTYVHVQMHFFLARSTSSSSSSTKGAVGIISKVAELVACIIGYNIALKMASSTSKATTCRFNFRQAVTEVLVKRLMSKSQHIQFLNRNGTIYLKLESVMIEGSQ
jgi:hypothetical protein